MHSDPPNRPACGFDASVGAYSVALCTYNGARYVREQVESIVGSRPPCAELVVVDDASRDETVALVEATTRPIATRLQLHVHRENEGSLPSFEQALRSTTESIVFVSDQDDRWHAGKVSRMLAEFAARPELLLLHTNACIVDESLQPLGYTLFDAIRFAPGERRLIRSGDAFDAFIRRNVATGATLAIRRELLDDALPIPPGWVHDEWLATIASAIGRVDYLDETLIDYRQHGSNQIGARRLSFRAVLRKALSRDRSYVTRQLERTSSLLERLVALGARVPADRVSKVARKLEHLKARDAFPSNRLARVGPILREVVAGRYARYSTGLRSVATDLCCRP